MSVSTSEPKPGRFPRPRLARLLASQIELRMILLIAVVMGVLSLISPYFLTVSNLFNVMDQSVVVGMVALGQTLVILIGGIDLSVGSIAGAAGIVLGLVCHQPGLTAGILACLAAGGFAGLVNGVIITYGGVAAFVVTLGMMSIGRSMAYVLSGANSISELPPGIAALSSNAVGGLPVNFVCLLVLYAAVLVVPDLRQGRADPIRDRLQCGGRAGRRFVDPAVERACLCHFRRDGRGRRCVSRLARAVDRPDRRRGAGTGRDRRRGDRRRQPVRRTRFDHRHAGRRVHNGFHSQRAKSAER